MTDSADVRMLEFVCCCEKRRRHAHGDHTILELQQPQDTESIISSESTQHRQSRTDSDGAAERATHRDIYWVSTAG